MGKIPTAGKGKGKKQQSKKPAGGGQAATVSRGAVRRLARQAGVRRIANGCYAKIQQDVRGFVRDIMEDTLAVLDVTGKKTIKSADILFALRSTGRVVYNVD
eukprot:Hpha_TRINITY_DN12790_c0_g1::TRINITY_DN12790_c0_g1_i1::g.114224::m.114224/K11254/H4; histone H4